MKLYKKIMTIVTAVENAVLAASFVFVLALTFGNVVARKIFNHSWGFTEELVVAWFVLISLLAAGVAARGGELVNLALVPDMVSIKVKKILTVISSIICVLYALLLSYEAFDRILNDHTFSPILHISKSVFWSFVLIGGISLALHAIEHCILFVTDREDNQK